MAETRSGLTGTTTASARNPDTPAPDANGAGRSPTATGAPPGARPRLWCSASP